MSADPIAAFIGGLPAALLPAPSELAVLSARLPVLLARARDAWPELPLPDDVFAAHLAARMAEEPGVLEQLERIAVADLWLACACCRGDSRAIAAFEHAYAAELRGALRRLRDPSLLPDDFLQLLRHRLFVADGGGRAAIERYSGHGNLGAWVRVTALRTALNATRNKPRPDRPGADEDLFEFAPSPDDPELDHLKRTYREAFREAFLDTVHALPAADRTLLRQSVVHGLTVRELGRMHGVHHATVARRLAAARDQLVEGTRRILGERLAVTPRELDSIMMLIRSRLEVSLGRALSAE